MTSTGPREWDGAGGVSLAVLAGGMRERLEQVPVPRRELACSYREDLIELRALGDRVEDLYLERLAAFESAGEYAVDGSLSSASWLRRHLGSSPARAKSDVGTARSLHNGGPHGAPGTAAALRDGTLSLESARVIARALMSMPTDRVSEAEAALLEASARLDSAGLAIVASRLRHLLRPEDALARQEYARSQRDLTLTTTWEGMWWLQGLLTPEDGATLKGVLDAMSAPTRCSTSESGESTTDDRLPGQRRADALGELARWAACAGVPPVQGGIRPHLVVRVDVGELAGTSGVASVGCADSAGRGCAVPGWLARMTACDANLSWIATKDVGGPRRSRSVRGSPQCDTGDVDAGELHPAEVDPAEVDLVEVDLVGVDLVGLVQVALAELAPALGGIPREVLAAGRSTRLVTPGQRAALNARDRGCVLPGCDRPPEWCEAHHLIEWIDGGATDLDNLALVCRRHHTMLHERGLMLQRARTGRFHTHPKTPETPRPRAPDTG